MKAHFFSNQGPARNRNEDRFVVKEFKNGAVLLAVADGMGGQAGGEKASQIAAASLEGFDESSEEIENHLIEIVHAAKHKVREASAEDASLEGMGTTLTVAFIRDGMVYWIHVGDSRFYLFREGILVQVTEDHNFPGLLLRAGEISEEEARIHPLRNMLFSCIGCGDFEVDMGSFDILPGDVLMLSTDGVHDSITESDMQAVLASKTDLSERLQSLVHKALSAGGRDDATVVAYENR